MCTTRSLHHILFQVLPQRTKAEKVYLIVSKFRLSLIAVSYDGLKKISNGKNTFLGGNGNVVGNISFTQTNSEIQNVSIFPLENH